MIIEFLVNCCVNCISALIGGVSMVSVPIQAVSVLRDFVSFGSYVVGADILLMFASVVVTWTTIKLTIGIGLFIWRLLPLT